MIKLFNESDTVFNDSNGEKIIKLLKCKITKGDISKDEYYADIEADVKYVDDLCQDKILVIPTKNGEQPFRINNPQKGSKLSFRAYHIGFDTKRYVSSALKIENKTATEALNMMVESSEETPFDFYSDIENVSSYEGGMQYVFDSICGIAEKWGGTIEFDGTEIKILSQIGEDRGVSIQYGKNLINISGKEDWNNVCTTLYAVGYDNITLDEPITASISYKMPYSKIVTFQPGDDVDITNKTAIKEDLLKQAQSYIQTNQYPNVTYTVSSNLENIVNVGDVVEVKHDALNISLITKVFSFVYDVLAKSYDKIVIGNYKQSLKEIFTNISRQVEEMKSKTLVDYGAISESIEANKSFWKRYTFAAGITEITPEANETHRPVSALSDNTECDAKIVTQDTTDKIVLSTAAEVDVNVDVLYVKR